MNKAGYDFLRIWERGPDGRGPALRAYPDSVGVWTIGYGHAGRYPHKGQVQPGDVLTLGQVEAVLAWDVGRTEAGLYRAEPAIPPSIARDSNREAAIVCLAFDIGVGAFRNSHLCRAIFDRDAIEARAADEGVQMAYRDWVEGLWRNWDHGEVDGTEEVIQGLLNRRNAELEDLWNRAA